MPISPASKINIAIPTEKRNITFHYLDRDTRNLTGIVCGNRKSKLKLKESLKKNSYSEKIQINFQFRSSNSAKLYRFFF